MAHFFLVVFACIAAAHAIVLPGTNIYQPNVLTKQVETVDVRPQYTFSYEVKDPSTGDIKNQVESRDGDVVKGSYSLLDADGLIRVVQYSADDVNGFNAVVSRTPTNKQVVAAPTIIKSVPILQQPTLIKSIPSILQGQSLIRTVPSVIQSQGLLRGIPSLVQSGGLSLGSQLSLGSPLSQAYSSSSLVRSPPQLGVSISGLKSSQLLY